MLPGSLAGLRKHEQCCIHRPAWNGILLGVKLDCIKGFNCEAEGAWHDDVLSLRAVSIGNS